MCKENNSPRKVFLALGHIDSSLSSFYLDSIVDSNFIES
jgi:hypothetical protein